MGLGKSKSVNVDAEHLSTGIYSDHTMRKWKLKFDMLRLSEKEVTQLYQVFNDCDISNKKLVNSRHIISYCKMEKVPFSDRMLASFKKGQPFPGFVFEIWDIVTTDESHLRKLRIF